MGRKKKDTLRNLALILGSSAILYTLFAIMVLILGLEDKFIYGVLLTFPFSSSLTLLFVNKFDLFEYGMYKRKSKARRQGFLDILAVFGMVTGLSSIFSIVMVGFGWL